jgi:cell wall assembly regulator SMI1
MDILAFRQRARTRAQRGLEAVWREYLAWLSETFPLIAANLKPPDPAAAQAFAELADILGVAMPDPMVTLYRLTGGEPCFCGEGGGSGVLFGTSLMAITDVVNYVRRPWNWRADGVEHDFEDEDHLPVVLEPTRLRAATLLRWWVPFGDDAGGNYVAVDLAPGPAGTVGQVINIGRDQEARFVLADDITEFVALLHELGAAGIVEIAEGGVWNDDGTESEDSAKAATRFAPTRISLIDQLRLWFFPDGR